MLIIKPDPSWKRMMPVIDPYAKQGPGRSSASSRRPSKPRKQ